MSAPNPAGLKRGISLTLLIYYGLGNILGAGIYVLVGKVAGVAGMFAPVSFLVASLLAAFTAFSFAELSARYPLSSAHSLYIQKGLGLRWLSMVTGLLIALAGVLSSAAIVQGFVGYLQVFLPVNEYLVIAMVVIILALVAAWGITESARIAALLTLLEVIGLLIIIWSGRDALANLPARWHELLPASHWHTWQPILLGGLLAFYAYLGFEDMATVAEEVQQPSRNMPIAIIAALVLSTLLYVMVSLVAVLSLPADKLVSTDAPLALIYEHNTGQRPVVITLIGMFAVINGALIQVIMVSRILYGMSRQGWLHAGLSRIHPVTRTPLITTLLAAVGVLVLAYSSGITRLAEGSSLVILVVFALVNLSLFRIKQKYPNPGEITMVPLWVPVMGFILSTTFILLRVFSVI